MKEILHSEDVLNSLSQCVFLVDGDRRIAFANAAMNRQYGAGRDSLAGSRCSDIAACCPALKQANLCPHETVFREGKAVVHRFDLTTADGWKKVFDLRASPVRNGNGSVVQMAAVMEDVTEIVSVRDMLERCADGLSILHEVTGSFLAVKGIENAVRSALKQIGEYYGADFTQVLMLDDATGELEYIAGTGWDDAERKKVKCKADRESLAGYVLLEKSPVIVTDFGKEKTFRTPPFLQGAGVTSGVSVPMMAGEKVIGVLCILFKRRKLVDTAELWYLNVVANSLAVYAEKEKSLQKIEESEAYLKSVLEGIGEGVVVVDRDLRVISANQSYLRSVGTSAEECRGKYCYQVSHQLERPCFENDEECTVKLVFETGGHHSAIHTHHDDEGNPLYVETHGYPIKDSSGNVVAAVETVMDVTERIWLEKDLEKRVKELEEFYDMAVDRELRMIELKEEIAELREELEKYRSR